MEMEELLFRSASISIVSVFIQFKSHTPPNKYVVDVVHTAAQTAETRTYC
jgi:hypothetical protein